MKKITLLMAVTIVALATVAQPPRSAKRGVSENGFNHVEEIDALKPGAGWFYNWANLPNSYVASSKGCEAGPDHLHFTTRGYRTLGTRYAIKMLQAMGFPITDGYSEQSESSLQQQPVLNVEASLVNNDVLHAVADAPLSKVEYVSFSGNVLKTIVKNGETVVDLDANLFPEERHLVIVFYGQNGATTSVDITR